MKTHRIEEIRKLLKQSRTPAYGDMMNHALNMELLLVEAASTVQASIAEDGISDGRRGYRKDLFKRITEFLK